MANEEQLSILKQGVEVWNKWRKENSGVYVDLVEANLAETNLAGANLSGVNLSRANLRKANLLRTDLSASYLIEAKLQEANLWLTDFWEADLTETNFLQAQVFGTIFASVNLSNTVDLENVVHHGPSIVSTDTFALSKGKIPEVFLQNCGISNLDIEYSKLSDPMQSYEEINKILYKIYDMRASQAIQISSLFISYSHADGPFVDKLEKHLTKRGLRFWRDIHDAKAGRLEEQINQAIRLNPTVLLILSEHSLKSDWVEHEVRQARRIQKDIGHDVLCPIALDDSWKNSRWPERVMDQILEYNILDFSNWVDDKTFSDMFRRLIDGLELFYKG